jgi:hypothetical protein
VVHRFKVILIKIPARCFIDIDQIILKCIWNSKGIQIAKSKFEKKSVEVPITQYHCGVGKE